MRPASAVRDVPTPVAVIVIVVVALAPALGPGVASAATIHACVKSKSGATRIVSARARCRHGEQRLSWNTSGPAGAPGPAGAHGAPGAEGHPGANGAVSAFSASAEEAVVVTVKETNVIFKTIPPGSYTVFGKTNLSANTEAPGFASVLCGLAYRPGTAVTGEATSVDLDGWEVPLGEKGVKEWAAVAPIGTQGAFATKVTVTVAMACILFPGSVPVRSSFAQLQAIGVSSIG